jgi:fimbrial chaperone protein
MSRLSTTLTVLAVSLGVPCLHAQAAGLEVNPVRVRLSASQRSQTVQLRNQGKEPLRYQVTAQQWQQSATGEMVLSPTRDLVVFPSLVELKPGETRRLKVARAVAPGAVEKTYRVFLEPLPDGFAQGPGTVRVLTRFNIPVFVQPAAPLPRPEVRLRVEQGKLVVSVSNAGNVYFMTRSVHVVGQARPGSQALDQVLPGWYVLAGGERVYSLPLLPAACLGLTRIDATVKTEHAVVRTALPVSSAVCGASAP